jgi:hypothetical protein
MIVEEKADIREIVGVALNAKSLRMDGRTPNASTPLMHVAAFGFAALDLRYRAAQSGRSIAEQSAGGTTAATRRDVISAELASLLWHVRYAGHHDLIPRTIDLIAEWLDGRARFRKLVGPERTPLLRLLGERALDELLSTRCPLCMGSKLQEKARAGKWVRPRGAMQRNATFRTCVGCNGTGRKPVSHAERCARLQITKARYTEERWDTHIGAVLVWIEQASSRLQYPLTRQLRSC